MIHVAPPSAAEIRRWDLLAWKGRPHHDYCVRMDDKTMTVAHVPHKMTAVVYTPEEDKQYPVPLQSDSDVVTLVMPDDKPFHGRVCYGIGDAP